MVNYSYYLERIIAMKYLTLFSDKLILFKKEAAVPAKGPTVLFFSTKLDVERKWAGRLTISESVVRSLSLPKNGKFFSNLVKQPLAFVVIAEGHKGPFRKERAAT